MLDKFLKTRKRNIKKYNRNSGTLFLVTENGGGGSEGRTGDRAEIEHLVRWN